MGLFNDVVLNWDGDTYTVPSDKVMRLVSKVEAELTRDYPDQNAFDLLSRPSGPPLSNLCSAYAVALKYAGANVDAEDVYGVLFSGNDNTAEVATLATMGLMEIMLPPGTFKSEGGESGGKSKASSKKRTSRRSAT